MIRLVPSRTRSLFRSLTRTISANSSNKPENSVQKIQDESANTTNLLEQTESFANDMLDTDIWTTTVYPHAVEHRRDQSKHSIRPLTDPRKTTIMLFPGQGSQFPGMCEGLLDYPNVKNMFEISSDILGYNLLELCLKGPKERLDRTEHCQPAILVTSLAAVEKLKVEQPEVIENCVGALGFSSGEFTALVFAGALSFEDGMKLIKVRGKAMQSASELVPSGMMNIFCQPDAKVKFACHAACEWCFRQGIEDPICAIANYLFPECKVLAGNKEALEFIELNANEFRIKKLKYLNVSGAFHTKLMKPAERVLAAALEKVEIKPPLIPVYCNIDGKPYNNPRDIQLKLTKQLCSPVKWEQTLHTVYTRDPDTPFPRTFECGPGGSLRAILKRVNLKAWLTSYTTLNK